MSLVQGGSGYPFFAPSVYAYIQGKDISDIYPGIEEVPNSTLRTTLAKVKMKVVVLLLPACVCGSEATREIIDAMHLQALSLTASCHHNN